MNAFIGFVVGWYALILCFIAIMHAKLRMEAGELSRFWKINLAPIGLLGLVLDVAFNFIVGTVLYLETPREFTFTSRCKRHKVKGGRRGDMARWWCKQLEQIEPGHC